MKNSFLTKRPSRLAMLASTAVLGLTAAALFSALGPQSLSTVVKLYAQDKVTAQDFGLAAKSFGIPNIQDSNPLSLALTYHGHDMAQESHLRASLGVAEGWVGWEAFEAKEGFGTSFDRYHNLELSAQRKCVTPGEAPEARVLAEKETTDEKLQLRHKDGKLSTYFWSQKSEGEGSSLLLGADGYDTKDKVLKAFPGLLTKCPEIGSSADFAKTLEVSPFPNELYAWGMDRTGTVDFPKGTIPELQGQEQLYISKARNQPQFDIVWDFKDTAKAQEEFDKLEKTLQKLQAPSTTDFHHWGHERMKSIQVVRKFSSGQVATSLETREGAARLRLGWASPDVPIFKEPNVPFLSESIPTPKPLPPSSPFAKLLKEPQEK